MGCTVTLQAPEKWPEPPRTEGPTVKIEHVYKVDRTQAGALQASGGAAENPKVDVEARKPIEVGESVPEDVMLHLARTFDQSVEDNFARTNIMDVLGEGKCVIFNMPGPFTGACSKAHVPNVMENLSKLQDAGFKVVITSATDHFAMNGWRKALSVETEGTEWYADCNADLAKCLGTSADLSMVGLHGPRATRYCAAFEGGRLIHLAVENAPTDVEVTTADAFLTSQFSTE